MAIPRKQSSAMLTPMSMTLDTESRALLATFRPVVAEHLDDLVADFLEYLGAWPEMRPLMQSADGVACLREAQGRHLLNLFSGTFDEGYFARVGRMGAAHERVGLEPRWYLGAYGHMLKRLVELAVEYCGADAEHLLGTVSVINRVVEIDMAFAVAAIAEEPSRPSATPEPSRNLGSINLAEAIIKADFAKKTTG